jgi:hypothetical protein
MDNSKMIDKLIEGYSTHSKSANVFWGTLILASTVSLTSEIDNNNLVELPLTLG